MTRIFGLVLALSLLIAPAAFAQDAAEGEEAQPTGETLTAEQVTELFSGNTERNEVMKRGALTGRVYEAFYDADGSYVMKEKSGFLHGGVWFVDPLGRLCFRPGGKDKTKCDVIAKEGDHYIRLRDGGLRGRVTVVKGNTSDLSKIRRDK
jgi:hypothetical protein